MELMKGYRFFSASDCDDLVRYCDAKEEELPKYHYEVPAGSTSDDKIPVTQRYHSLYKFFAEYSQHLPRLLASFRES